MRSTRVAGHGLQAEGKAVVRYNSGDRLRLTYEDKGVTYCECGEVSSELPSIAARKRWHAEHKAKVVEALREAGNLRYPSRRRPVVTKRLTDEQEAEVEAIASARCDKAAKIAAAMLRAGAFEAARVEGAARAVWAVEAGTRPPSDKTWACVVRLVESVRPVWEAASALLEHADPSEEEPSNSLVDTEDLTRLRMIVGGEVPPAKVAKAPPDCGLEIVCSVCIGSKVVQSEKWAEWFALEDTLREGARATDDPAFYPGSPKHEEFLARFPYPDEPEEFPCPMCGGIGTVPTELGEALLAFLRPRFAETVRP